MHELAVGTGLLAYSMLLVQFVSSGRFEKLSARVGIDRTMRFHQLTARALTLLALLHALLQSWPPNLSEIPSALQTFGLVLQAPHLRSAVIALGLLLVMVPLAIARNRLPIGHEAWRASHALAALAIALAGAHHAMSVGTYGAQPLFSAIWAALALLALGSIGHVYLVKPWWLAKTAYRLTANREAAAGIREIVLDPAPGRPLKFDAGQFAWLNFGGTRLPFRDHPFSISSSPEELPRLRFLIRERGDFSAALGSLPVGTQVSVDAPHGNFTLRHRHGDAICLIAGGIGIAPVMGILRHLHASRDRRPITVLYGGRKARQMPYCQEISAMAGVLDLHSTFLVEEPEPGWQGKIGRFDDATLRAALRAESGRCLCLVCGPTPMMLDIARRLRAAGVPRRQVVYERFEYD
jgi:predicted ferric reductase